MAETTRPSCTSTAEHRITSWQIAKMFIEVS